MRGSRSQARRFASSLGKWSTVVGVDEFELGRGRRKGRGNIGERRRRRKKTAPSGHVGRTCQPPKTAGKSPAKPKQERPRTEFTKNSPSITASHCDANTMIAMILLSRISL